MSSESTPSLPVLIVGAGVAGLVSALALAKNGIQLRIIDRAAEFHIGSRGFGIQPRTFELFKALGVLEDIRAVATDIPSMRAYKLPGGTLPIKTWDLYEKRSVWPDRPYANGACLGQDHIEAILRKHLGQYGIKVELNRGLVGLKQENDRVTAVITSYQNGTPASETETVVSQYVIGTDGAKGVTRKLLGLTFEGETRDADGMVWGDVEIPNLSNEYWHIWAKPGQFTIMARPIKFNEKHIFGVGVTGQNFDPVDLAVSDKIIKFIKKETGREELEFGEWTWLSYFKPNMRMVNKFSEKRVFLAGDSAHVHSPSGGQGMNCAVQDACNIAWKVALVLKGISPTSLLDSYNVERLPVIAQMLSATSALYTHMVAKSKPTEEVAQKATEEDVENDKKLGFYRWRNTALELYGINYRYSPVVVEERDPNVKSWDLEKIRANAYAGYEGGGTLCAGDRAPEAPDLVDEASGDVTSILQILGVGWHTILISGPASLASDVISTVKKYPEGFVKTYVIVGPNQSGLASKTGARTLVDKDGHAHNAYGFDDDKGLVVIIRPDSFIGGIVKDAAGVGRYFGKICI